jgi:quinolinate synthase
MCFDMKKNTLSSIYLALENESPVVSVDESVAKRAKMAIDRMLAICK